MIVPFPLSQSDVQMQRVQQAVEQHRNAPFKSADWLAGELITICETAPANDSAAALAERARLTTDRSVGVEALAPEKCGATSEDAIRHLAIRDQLNRTIYKAVRGYSMGNMCQADDPSWPYPLVDLMSNPAPADISSGEMEMVALVDEIAHAVAAMLAATPPVPATSEPVQEAFVKLCEALGIPATAGAYLEVPRLLPVPATSESTWATATDDQRERVTLLAEVELHLQSSRVFVTSREKMHPCGVDLHDELLTKVTAAIDAIGREKVIG